MLTQKIILFTIYHYLFSKVVKPVKARHQFGCFHQSVFKFCSRLSEPQINCDQILSFQFTQLTLCDAKKMCKFFRTFPSGTLRNI